MTERLTELTKKSLRTVARHKAAVDMTIYPNGAKPPEPMALLEEIKKLTLETPQDVRTIRRRVKRRSPF